MRSKITKNDVESIKKALKNPEEIISDSFLNDLDEIEDKIIENHVKALGWMVANNKLKIKIAIKLDDKGYPLDSRYGILHQKIGILTDKENNKISFSGSNNETFAGWNENMEEFKVFRGWKELERQYLNSDSNNFDNYWNEESERIKIIDIPIAIKRELIKIAPKKIDDLNFTPSNNDFKKSEINLYDYQNKAIRKWIENGKKGIFEMATGTGKTYTALGCLEKINHDYGKLVTIITSPYHHLVEQWKKEITKFGINYDELIIADSTNPAWKNILSDSLDDLYLGYKNKIIILTTHRTLSSKTFMDLTKNQENLKYFLIADEVHGLGAELSIKGLLRDYNLRLGLSATPKRWFDDFGTDFLYDYFGGTVFEFSLEKAIENNFLTPFRYLPIFVSLNQEELDNYIEVTKAIAVNFNNLNNNENKKLESLIFKRANIIKNSEQKYKALEEIIDNLGADVNWSIIYCTDRQIKKVMKTINKRYISAHLFTMNEGTSCKKEYGGISEREYILKKFSEEKYKILVAMKCLDEGVDIPPARTAIFMSSSGNPREYIQRIGRIIRKYDGKKEALIYDIVVVPSLNKLPSYIKDVEMKIFEKEINRCEQIAKIAVNNAKALRILYDLKKRLS